MARLTSLIVWKVFTIFERFLEIALKKTLSTFSTRGVERKKSGECTWFLRLSNFQLNVEKPKPKLSQGPIRKEIYNITSQRGLVVEAHDRVEWPSRDYF